MPGADFRIEPISFLLGFLAASLLWWAVSRVRPLVPLWLERTRRFIRSFSQRNLESVDERLRVNVLHLAQGSHLASALFSLDEVIIPPRLLAPPPGHGQAAGSSTPSIAGRVIPYLPDFPELVATFSVPTITPAQALQSGRNLVFTGQAGCGKTVALAYLASQMSRRDPQLGKYSGVIPLFIHAVDVDTSTEDTQDPIELLIRVVSSGSGVMMQTQVPRFLRATVQDSQRKVALLIDGLDELPKDRAAALTAYLGRLLGAYPRIQVIATASVDFLDGLTRIGFYPLTLAAWGQAQRLQLQKKWNELWCTRLLPEARKQAGIPEIDPSLIEAWLCGETTWTSPFEWTLRVWGAYAGDMSGAGASASLESYLARYLPDAAYLPALAALAHDMAIKSTPSLRYDAMEKYLSSPKLERTSTSIALAKSGQKEPDQAGVEKLDRKKVIATQGEQVITGLIKGGVLVETPGGQVRFANPVLLGYLAGMQVTDDEATAMVKALDWPVQPFVLQYAAACTKNPEWIIPLVDKPDPPLFRGYLLAARWLRDAPPGSVWAHQAMLALVSLIQNESLPLGIRARITAAFYLSGDPSTAKFFKQLLASRSPVIRRVALLGCGALNNPVLVDDILNLLVDPVPEVRYTACLALAAMPGEPALKAVVEILLSGDEELRQAAAEALAMNQPEGHQVLEEAAALEDLLARRAAVYGLQQVGEPWARKLLEKIASDDGQWVVRNAATQALDALQKTSSLIPRPLPKPSEAPWLITFASKLGVGLAPGSPGTDVLLLALKSGSVEEQVAALQYLKSLPEEGIIGAIYQLLYSGIEDTAEPAIQALWWMAASGARLPSPTQFGLG